MFEIDFKTFNFQIDICVKLTVQHFKVYVLIFIIPFLLVK